MHTDDLHRPLYCADILVNALNQDPTRPLLQTPVGKPDKKALRAKFGQPVQGCAR
jgi:hypothetical protein